MIVRILTTSIVALGLGLMAEGAKADQTFLCGDGRIVQVSMKDLERLKREDSCIGAHFQGQTPKIVPLPSKRPAQAGVLLKGAKGAARVHDANVAVAQAIDYRNVRIINATSGGNQWYRHRR